MKKFLKWFLFISVIFIGIIISLRIFGLEAYKYQDRALSMQPTLSPGDIVICIKNRKIIPMQITKGKVYLIWHKNYDYLLTKRLIAIGGDTIQIIDNVTYINHKLLEEPYLLKPSDKGSLAEFNMESLVIPEGKLFVMGDNRSNSTDSRDPDFGLVSEETISGRVMLIVWSKDIRKVGRIL
jgi:signal peptidase I